MTVLTVSKLFSRLWLDSYDELVRSSIEDIFGRKICLYTSEKCEKSLFLALLVLNLHYVRSMFRAQEAMKGSFPPFMLEPELYTTGYKTQLTSELRAKEKSISARVLEENGLSTANIETLFSKVHLSVKKFFSEQVPGFSTTPNPSGEASKNYTAAKEFFETCQGKIQEFAFRECQFSEMKNELYDRADFSKIAPTNIDKMNCHLYAAARTDSSTFFALLDKEKRSTRSDPSSLIDLAPTLWKCVENPEIGDSVLYYNKVTGKIGHTGIYRGAGKVESKPGNESKSIFTHDLFGVTAFYGTHLFFMRQEKVSSLPRLNLGSYSPLVDTCIETIKGRTIQLYSCKDNEKNLQFTLLLMTLKMFLNLLIEEIKKQLTSLNRPPYALFPHVWIDIVKDELCLAFGQPTSTKLLLFQVLEKNGLTVMLFQKLWPRLKAICEKFFTVRKTFSVTKYDQTKINNHVAYIFNISHLDELNAWKAETEAAIFGFVCQEHGFSSTPINLEEHPRFNKMPRFIIEDLSCHLYATAKMDPIVSTDLIIKELGKKTKTPSIIDIDPKLWSCIDIPEPQDLVLYYNSISKEITHTGIYIGEGKVESKPGARETNILIHHVFDLLSFYGTHVFFMRRNKVI